MEQKITDYSGVLLKSLEITMAFPRSDRVTTLTNRTTQNNNTIYTRSGAQIFAKNPKTISV